jgi:hypothetical protein
MNHTTTQRDSERLQQQLEVVMARLKRLREAADPAKDPLASPSLDVLLYDAREEVAHLRRALSMAGRRWRCELCGEEYGPEWVAAWGLRCHVECDGELVEVRNG